MAAAAAAATARSLEPTLARKQCMQRRLGPAVHQLLERCVVLDRVQRGARVEDLRHEGHVELRVAAADILRLDERVHAEPHGVADDVRRALLRESKPYVANFSDFLPEAEANRKARELKEPDADARGDGNDDSNDDDSSSGVGAGLTPFQLRVLCGSWLVDLPHAPSLVA